MQPAAALALALMTRARSGNVMLYTGYTWEEVMTFPSETVRELLHHLELMVDGPFLEAEKEEGLVFRGSRNQRIIKVQPSLANGEIVLWHNAGKEEE